MPSSSGTPAATSAPNAITRITRVTGSEVASALLKSPLTSVLTALTVLAVPSSPTNNPGYARCTAAVAASAGATRFCEVSGSPVIWKITSAARPLFEICPAFPGASGERIAATDGMLDSRPTRSATAAR